MNEIENLKFNLIKKYRSYNLPSSLYHNAATYAAENKDKNKSTLIELASNYIEMQLLNKSKENEEYKKIVEQIYNEEASIFSTRNKVPIIKTEENKEKIIEKISKKDNYKIGDTVRLVIRKQLEKSLLKYKIEKRDNRILREVPNKDEIPYDENMYFLRKFYNLTELSNITGISIYELSNCLVNRRVMSSKIKEKILTSFSVSDSEELFEKLTNTPRKKKKLVPKKEIKKEATTAIKVKKEKVSERKNMHTSVTSSKTYSITFLKDYFEVKQLNKTAFAKYMGVSIETVNNWFNGKLFKEKYLETLLNYFEIDSLPNLISSVRRELNDIFISELNGQNKKEVLVEKKIQSNDKTTILLKNDNSIIEKTKTMKYDISFFYEYIRKKHMSTKKLCDILGLSSSSVNRFLVKERLLKEEELKLLLKYFEVSNYDELKNKILEESKNAVQKDIKTKKYDITFINKYIEAKNMTKTKLAKILNMSCATVIKVLKGERLLKEGELELLLKYFNKESYLELKEFFIKMPDEILIKNKVKSKRETNKIYDISFFYNYIKSKNINKNELLVILNVSNATLYKMLKGERLLSKNELELLLRHFNKESYLELKEFIKGNGWIKVSNLENEKTYSLKFFDTYLSSNGILLKQFADTMNIRQDELFNYIKKGKFVSEKTLKLFLDKFEVSTYDELKEKVLFMNSENTKELILHLDERVAKTTNTRLNNSYYNISFLKSYVKEKKIKIVDLASYLKISPSSLSNYLSGKSEINVEHINKLCKYFNVETINELEEIVKNTNSKYKINKYRKYILSKVSIDELSKKLNVEVSTVKNMLDGNTNVKKEQFDKILEILGIKDIKELKIKTDELNEKQNNIGDLTCVREYLKLKNIYLSSLATDIGITHQRLGQYLSNSVVMPYNLCVKMLEKLGFNSLEELNEYIKQASEKTEKCYEEELQIIRKYMKLKNITFTDLSVPMGVNYTTISGYINNKTKMSYDKFNKMLECLGFENVNQIKQIIKQYENKINVELDNIDMTCVKEYMKKAGIKQKQLAEDLNISTVTAYKWLNNQSEIKTKDFIRLLKYLGFETLKQLKDKLEELKNNRIGKSNPENSLYIEYIKTYMKNNDITYEELAKKLGKNTWIISDWFRYNVRISNEEFELLIKCLGFNTIDELILSLNEASTIDEDIETIKKYILINEITHASIAAKTDYTQSSIRNWLNDKPKMNSVKIKIVLNALGFNNITELKEELAHTKGKINSKKIEKISEVLIEKNEEDNDEVINLTPLKKYLKKNNITQMEIASLLNMHQSNFNACLLNKRTISKNRLKIILEYLGFNNYDELLDKVNDGFKEKIQVQQDKRFECALKIVDTEFKLTNDLGDVIKTKTSQSFTSTNCSIDNLERILSSLGFNKVDEFSQDTKEETKEKLKLNDRVNNQYLVYNYVDNYDKNSIITQRWQNKNPKILISELTDIIKCINFELINSNRKVNNIKMSSNLDKIEARKLINNEVLFELLKNEQVTEEEYKSIILLFGAKDNKYYSISEISSIVGINESTVLKIYKKCIELYSEAFKEDYSKIAKYLFGIS